LVIEFVVHYLYLLLVARPLVVRQLAGLLIELVIDTFVMLVGFVVFVVI
jgi:hypothetical protein